MKQVAGVLVKNDGKFLLVQERIAKAYGLWNLPAGHIDAGEPPEEAALRECREETGLSVRVGKEVYTVNDGYADIQIFEADLVSGDLKWDSDELLSAGWFSKDQIKTLPLREESFRKLLLGS